VTSREIKLEARIRQLEADNQRLSDEYMFLKESLVPPDWMAPIEFRLTGKESIILGVLVKHDSCSKQQLHTAVNVGNFSADDETEIKIVDVFVCKLRKKIKLFDFKIETVWGHGYAMSKADRDDVLKMCR